MKDKVPVAPQLARKTVKDSGSVLTSIPYVISALLKEQPTNNLPKTITEECYEKAIEYVRYLHAQKELFAEIIKAIVEPATERPQTQPTDLDISAAILRFLGQLVTF